MRVLPHILLLFISLSVNAETLQSASQTKTVADEIMRHFVKENFVEGIEIAKKYWPSSPAELDALANQISEQWTVVRKN